MTKFSYTAVNAQNNVLKGVIEAENENMALNELHFLNLTVIEIRESHSETIVDNKKIFSFKAIDPSGKNIEGTIKGENELMAYKRLSQEYNFLIQSLNSKNEQGEEIAYDIQKIKKDLNIQENEEKMGKLGENVVEKNTGSLVGQKIEAILKQVETKFQEIKTKIKKDAAEKIQKQIDKLKLIKNSSNITYIEEICYKLLSDFENKEIYEESALESQEFTETALFSKKLSQEFKKNIAGEKETFALSIKNALEKISNIKFFKENAFFSNFFSEIKEKIKNFFEVDPALMKIRADLSENKSRIINNYILLFKSDQKSRETLKKEISNLKVERKVLKEKFALIKKELRIKRDAKMASTTSTKFSKFVLTIHSFSSFLLCFYLIYYVLSFLLLTKNFGFNAFVTWNFNIYNLPLIKYFLIISFIVHICTAIKIHFLKNSATLNYPLGFFCFSLIILAIINF